MALLAWFILVVVIVNDKLLFIAGAIIKILFISPAVWLYRRLRAT